MSSNLSDYQFNIDCYMHKMLYTNLMVTTNQKSIVDTQEIKTKNPSKHITKQSHHNTREESKGKKEQRRTTKITIQ